jgi:hypothetical protein
MKKVADEIFNKMIDTITNLKGGNNGYKFTKGDESHIHGM